MFLNSLMFFISVSLHILQDLRYKSFSSLHSDCFFLKTLLHSFRTTDWYCPRFFLIPFKDKVYKVCFGLPTVFNMFSVSDFYLILELSYIWLCILFSKKQIVCACSSNTDGCGEKGENPLLKLHLSLNLCWLHTLIHSFSPGGSFWYISVWNES